MLSPMLVPKRAKQGDPYAGDSKQRGSDAKEAVLKEKKQSQQPD